MERRELFEERPVIEAVLKLSVPSILGQVILALYNIADTFFVSLTNSDILITAVSISSPIFMILSAIANLFGIGGSSLMSKYLGIHDHDRARKTSSYAFFMCLFSTIIYSLLVFIFLNPLLNVIGGKDELVHMHAYEYIIITVSISGVFSSLSVLLSQLLRAEGRSFHASFGLILGGILNIILDPIFLFLIFPSNGILGCAIATALSNLISFIYYFSLCLKKREHKIIVFRINKDIFNKEISKNVILVGIPACLMTLFENISFAVLDGFMALNGTEAQAGLGVAKKVNMLAHCIVRGMSQGILPMIAYNYADGKRQRMKKIVYTAGAISLMISIICMVLGITLSNEIISIFIDKTSESNEYGSLFLRILALGAPFSAVAYTIISFFQATGKGFRSTILALLRKGILDIPLMFILNNLIEIKGCVFATPIADVLCFLIAIILFTVYIKNHSKDKVVLHN